MTVEMKAISEPSKIHCLRPFARRDDLQLAESLHDSSYGIQKGRVGHVARSFPKPDAGIIRGARFSHLPLAPWH